jgi:flagellar hook assembly protein FlgD
MKKTLTQNMTHDRNEHLMITNVNSAGKISPKRLFSRAAFFLSFVAFASLTAVQQSHALTVSLQTTSDLLQVPPQVDYSLSWTSVAPSTTDAHVYYYIYQEFGLDGVSFSTPGNHVGFTDETSFLYEGYPGARCFTVISSDTAGGPAFSDSRCHDFVYSVDRQDEDDSQRGVGLRWEFTFSMDVDAKLTSKIYPPGTQFTLDSNGFIVGASSGSIRTLVDSTPRSGSIRGVTVTQEWDSRSSTDGVHVSSYVPNGIYYLLVQATLDSGQIVGTPPVESPALSSLETYLRSGRAFPIPIDILRISDVKATPITLTETQSRITYFINGNATVRVVIAKPGSFFNVTNTGDVDVISPTTGNIDNTLLVSSFTYQRIAGDNVETWDGTSSTGTVMPKGNYVFAITATDDHGNRAVAPSEDDTLIVGVIPVERTAGSTSGTDGSSTGDTTPPSIASILVNGATFTDGQLFSGEISTITVRLSDPSGISFGSSQIAVVGPNSQTIPGTLSNNGSDTMTFVFSTPQTANGSYTITVTAADALGNSASGSSLTRGVETAVVLVQLTQGEFEASAKMYPNPAKNTTSATISYTLNVASVVNIEIFNILGEKVYSTSTSASSINWDLKNTSGKKVGSGVYLVRIKATGGGVTVETTKKLVVIQ